ncbi:MAG: AbrB/MazE/SpoVT family DNA-binding domain-containing protein [Terracidiphilus sp.]
MLTKTVKLRKRGNGLWITIPAAIVREHNLKPGDEAKFTQTGEHEFELSRLCSQCGAAEKIMTFSRVMPPGTALNRVDVNKQ